MEQPREPEERVVKSSGPADTSLTPPSRKVPMAFRLAELLPFRWWYIWTLFMVAVAPIALWIQLPMVFAAVAVLTLAGIYGAQLWDARTRIGLLRWGRVATVTNTETLSRATYYSGTTSIFRWRTDGLSGGSGGAARTPRRRFVTSSTAARASWWCMGANTSTG